MNVAIAKVEALSRRQGMLLGMWYGLYAWAGYWAVETGFVTFVRWALRHHTAPPQPPLFLGILLLCYLCAGGVLGAIVGWAVAALRPTAPRRAFAAASTLTMLVVFAIATRHFIESWKGPVLAVLILLCLASARAGIWGKRLAVFSHPWAASLLVLGAYVSYASGSSERMRIGLFGLHAVVVVGLGTLWLRRSAGRQTESIRLPAALAAALVVGGLSLACVPFPITSKVVQGTVAAGSPNVILIVLDTVRAEHMSVYGYGRDTTPQLRALAKQATTYTHAFSAGDMTLIGHASMFTGLYPAHHGAHYAADSPLGLPLAEHFRTMAEILAEKGYDTLGIVANDGYVSEQYGLSQGFAYYDQRPPRAPSRATPLYTLSGRFLEMVSDRWPTAYLMRIARTAEEINQQADGVLSKEVGSQRPFFLFLNYLDAHVPYVPPPPYDRMYPGKDSTLNRPRLDEMRGQLFAYNRPISEPARRHLESQYDGGIAYQDAHLGRLFASLRQKNFFDDALIIVTSDHGEAFGEHGILNHGGMALYQSQVAIPLLIKYPRQRSAAVVGDAVSGVDLLPTVLDTLKLPIPAGLDGRSLRQIQPDGNRAVVSQSYPGGTAVYINPKRFSRSFEAILCWPFKLIRPSAGPMELYDLGSDPGEQRNLYQPDSSTARRLDARLSGMIHATVGKGKRPANIDSETFQRLKSLGYIQ